MKPMGPRARRATRATAKWSLGAILVASVFLIQAFSVRLGLSPEESGGLSAFITTIAYMLPGVRREPRSEENL